MQQVACYRNLHKQCFSIVGKKEKRVIDHCTAILLQDVTFRVSEAGRQRVLREKRKNVHSKVHGTLLTTGNSESADSLLVNSDLLKESIPVSYNPYKGKYFFNKNTGRALKSAKLVLLYEGKSMVAVEPVYYAESEAQ